MKTHKRIIAVLLLLLIAGCAAPSQAPASPSTPACTTKDCFIAAANACDALDVTLTEEAGVIKYSSSKDCVFTKTLVSAPGETQEMKALVEGKSLTCTYENGKFDPRWATSLIFGIERCEGPLKDILVELLAFA